MATSHLISRVTILGTGLIGGSFALALRKYATDVHISGWDREDVIREAQKCGAIERGFSGSLEPALRDASLIYIALPVGFTLNLLPEIARLAPPEALVTDACSTKVRITQEAAEHFADSSKPLFLGGHPIAGKEVLGVENASPELFQGLPYALMDEDVRLESATSLKQEPRVAAFLKLLQKIGAQPMWLGARQHDYAVGLTSHLPQLLATALGSFLYDQLDENGLPITLSGTGLRDSLRLAGSSYTIWRDIILTNRELLSASLDLFARRLDDLRERLASRDLEGDFNAANELYKLLREL